ncbi:M23 family metallopeptidase [Nocardioides sp. URHA0032]|uniref:M23 family metallopeptidase n=1 Tax=Nocardioides sp. URHA0032 TaxID=1380388 RepID=UPI0012DEDAF2|nr:peptidoglycan DD-metalloendopeptidase family protein [Nocardioides sp. URHA0032]
MGNRGKRAAARVCAGAAVVAVVTVGAAAGPAHAQRIALQLAPADSMTALVPAASRSADRRQAQVLARTVAAAATWHVSPRLLRPHPTDSAGTAAARQRLADLATRLRDRTTAYDAAQEAAWAAGAAARAADAQLRAARAALGAAQQQYRHDRDVLVSALTGSYTMTQLAPVAAALTADDASVLEDLTRLEELGRSQVAAVEAADRSRDELAVAELAFDVAAREADGRLGAAREALAAADRAHRSVLLEVRSAQSELAELAREDRVVRDALADGYRGAITFPLAPGTPFRDLDNFGARSGRWQSTHTGDDLAAACGSLVVAANGGTVMVRTDQAWSGRWLVMVSTATGSLTTWYAHLQALEVADGQPVVSGAPIGRVGQEGNATGCHLHFEVHPFGGSIYEDDTDPRAWLLATGAYPA